MHVEELRDFFQSHQSCHISAFSMYLYLTDSRIIDLVPLEILTPLV